MKNKFIKNLVLIGLITIKSLYGLNLNISSIKEETIKLPKHRQLTVIKEGRDALFVLGNIGSGKSTTIAYLLGAQLEKKRVGGRNVVDIVEREDNGNYPEIGHKFESLTQNPQIYKGTMGTYFVDCPAFFDSKKENGLNISNDLELIIQKQNRRKLLIVSSYSMLSNSESRGKNIKNLFKILGTMFRRVSDIPNSVMFGFTTLEDNVEEKDILDILQDPTNGVINALKQEVSDFDEIIKVFKQGTHQEKQEIMGPKYNFLTSEQENFDAYMGDIENTKNAIWIINNLSKRCVIVINPLKICQKNKTIRKLKYLSDVSAGKLTFDKVDYPHPHPQTSCSIF